MCKGEKLTELELDFLQTNNKGNELVISAKEFKYSLVLKTSKFILLLKGFKKLFFTDFEISP